MVNSPLLTEVQHKLHSASSVIAFSPLYLALAPFSCVFRIIASISNSFSLACADLAHL